jgi:hypothetical protein
MWVRTFVPLTGQGAACSCTRLPSGGSAESIGRLPTAEVRGEVAEFNVDPPRSIALTSPDQGVAVVYLDEILEGDDFANRTATDSRDGCPLVGPPIQSGAPIVAVDAVGQDGRFVASALWVLGIEIGDAGCEGFPAP